MERTLDRGSALRAPAGDAAERPEGASAELRARAREAAERLEGAPAEEIIAWAAESVPRLALTSSFGADSAPLLHLLSRVAPQVPVLFLETGFHFSETLDYRRGLANALGLRVVDVQPEQTVAEQAARHGPALHDRDPDACCLLRKTLPLRAALADYDGWVTGLRRSQTPERAETPVVAAVANDERWVVKVAPLANWQDEDVAAYQRRHGLPAHPLVARGYRSIGCAPCTGPVADGQDPRAGRWADRAKAECGIHLPHGLAER